jgi:hypothetical protein
MAESYITRKGGGGGAVGNYSTWAVQDENGVKYEAYNGYDYFTNPNPGNTPKFNQWLINNSTTKDILIKNTIMSNFLYNTNILNYGVPAFINNFPSLGGDYNTFYKVLIENNQITVAGGYGNFFIASFNLINRGLIQRANFAGTPYNNSSGASFGKIGNNIYIGATDSLNIRVFNATNNFSFVSQVSMFASVLGVATNNSAVFAYAARQIGNNRGVVKYSPSLSYLGATPNYGGVIYQGNYFSGYVSTVAFNQGNFFIGGQAYDGNNQPIEKFSESSLGFLARTVSNYAAGSPVVRGITVTNNKVFATFTGSQRKLVVLHESNLAQIGEVNLVSSMPSSSEPSEIIVYQNYVHIAGAGDTRIHTFHENNLVYLGNTGPTGQTIYNISLFNNKIYTGGWYGGYAVKEFSVLVPEKNTGYKIENVKE